MKTYQSTSIKLGIAAALLSLAIVVGLLEVVAGAFLYPDAETAATRRETYAAQADQVARARALADGQIKSASSARVPGN